MWADSLSWFYSQGFYLPIADKYLTETNIAHVLTNSQQATGPTPQEQPRWELNVSSYQIVSIA